MPKMFGCGISEDEATQMMVTIHSAMEFSLCNICIVNMISSLMSNHVKIEMKCPMAANAFDEFIKQWVSGLEKEYNLDSSKPH